MNRTETQRLLTLVITLIAATSFGCAFGEIRPDDWLQRQYSLEEKHKSYSDSIRWAKYHVAASFMETESRAAFVKSMPDFEHLRFNDWEADPWSLDDEEKRNATIHVRYTGYSMRTLTIVVIQETQTWVREGKGNAWTVTTTFEGIESYAKN
jgi:hypothetical protein